MSVARYRMRCNASSDRFSAVVGRVVEIEKIDPGRVGTLIIRVSKYSAISRRHVHILSKSWGFRDAESLFYFARIS